jgi:hypothetical protein
MVTIAHVVEKIVRDRMFLQEAMSKGIINYAALAEHLQKDVENEMGRKTETAAIMMALRRLNDKLEGTFAGRVRFTPEADVSVKSDLFELTLKKSKRAFELIKKIYDLIDPFSDFFATTQGTTQMTIISSKRHKKHIQSLLKGEHVVKVIDDLACIGTTIPLSAVDECGYFYTLTKAFVWENIPIVEIVSTLTELNLVIAEKDIPRAFKLVKQVIKEHS